VRGLNVVYDRSYSYLGVRGFFAPGDYNTRVLLLIDGNRVNENLYDMAFIGTEAPIDIDLVERIEFIPGQGSPVYGANAFFGVVNVVTRPISEQRSNVALGAEQYGGREGRATLSRTTEGGAKWMVSASRRTYDGTDVTLPGYTSALAPDGVAHGVDYERRSSFYAAAELGDLSVRAMHADRDKGIGVAPPMLVGDPRNSFRDVETLLDAATQPRAAGRMDHARLRRPVPLRRHLCLRLPADHAQSRRRPRALVGTGDALVDACMGGAHAATRRRGAALVDHPVQERRPRRGRHGLPRF